MNKLARAVSFRRAPSKESEVHDEDGTALYFSPERNEDIDPEEIISR